MGYLRLPSPASGTSFPRLAPRRTRVSFSTEGPRRVLGALQGPLSSTSRLLIFIWLGHPISVPVRLTFRGSWVARAGLVSVLRLQSSPCCPLYCCMPFVVSQYRYATCTYLWWPSSAGVLAVCGQCAGGVRAVCGQCVGGACVGRQFVCLYYLCLRGPLKGCRPTLGRKGSAGDSAGGGARRSIYVSPDPPCPPLWVFILFSNSAIANTAFSKNTFRNSTIFYFGKWREL